MSSLFGRQSSFNRSDFWFLEVIAEKDDGLRGDLHLASESPHNWGGEEEVVQKVSIQSPHKHVHL